LLSTNVILSLSASKVSPISNIGIDVILSTMEIVSILKTDAPSAKILIVSVVSGVMVSL